jgi:cytoplasmic iron level regulating protein YaaA (DUF328/UPF0246 family)
VRLILPPSETKRVGGEDRSLDLRGFALASLLEQREQTTDALVALAGDADTARRVLKLSERQLGDIADNAQLRTAPTMPAVDRYTGVLFDALDATSLDETARAWLGEHVWIHTAPWGPVGALDAIPRYRLAAGTSLPGIPPLRRFWAEATRESIAAANPGFILDLRSEAYVALGPIPGAVASAYVKVVTSTGAALNHFNKKTKGELVRTLAETRPRITTLADFTQWAAQNGWVTRLTDPGTIELVTA